MSIAYAYPTTYTATKDGNWTNPGNVTANDGVYMTASPAYSAIYGTLFTGINFSLPTGATINSIKIQAEHRLGSSGTTPQLWYFEIKGTDSQTLAHLYTIPLTDTEVEYNAAHTYTVSELNSGALKLEMRCTHNVSARTFYIDYLRVAVDYTEPATTNQIFVQII